MQTIRPVGYQIHLEPNLRSFEFEGRVRLFLEASSTPERVSLDCIGLDVRSCLYIGSGEPMEVPFELTGDRLCLLPPPYAPAGPLAFEIRYAGRISDDMRGFYRSRYLHEGRAAYLAVTQFEENDARRAFPCFDRPDMKAWFDIEIVIEEGQSALANTPVLSLERTSDGRRLVAFERTPRMATYLVFFGVGDFDFLEGPGHRVPLRVAAAPGRARYGIRALELARESLEYFESYTDLRFPIGKLDLIAVPDFAYGAMENFAAVTYRENCLLYYPGLSSRADEQAIAAVTAHELAHQWFGDIVSPREWRYMWLNEAFATYFGYVAVQDAHPDWGLLHDFLVSEVPSALRRDALPSSPAIEPPDGAPVAVDASSAPIFYAKAAAVLHMLRTALGHDRFRSGVRSYLKTYAFDCADSADFLQAFGRGIAADLQRAEGCLGGGPASPASSISMGSGAFDDLIAPWITRPGYPLVRAECADGILSLSQERFTLSAPRPENALNPADGAEHQPVPSGIQPSASSAAARPIWKIPLTVLFFDEHGVGSRRSLIFDTCETRIELPHGVTTVKLNAEQAGFYRVAYDESAIERLGSLLRSGRLSQLDAWGLIADQEALVMKGEFGLERCLAWYERFASELAGGREPLSACRLPLMGLAAALGRFASLVPSERLLACARRLLAPALEHLGSVPRTDEAPADSKLRTALAWALLAVGDRTVRARYAELFDSLVAGAEVPADVHPLVVAAGAIARPDKLDWFRARIDDSRTTEAHRRNLLNALGWFEGPETLEAALDYVAGSVAEQNRMFAVGSAAGNPHARRLLWPWLIRHLGRLEGMHVYHFTSILASVISAAVDERAAVESFLSAYLERPQAVPARAVIEMSLELLDVRCRLVSASVSPMELPPCPRSCGDYS